MITKYFPHTKKFSQPGHPSTLYTIILALAITYGGGYWLHWVHKLEEAHTHGSGHHEPHWLLLFSLALPVVFTAVALSLSIGKRLMERSGREIPRTAAILAPAALAALAGSAVMAFGAPLRGLLFEGGHHQDMPILVHVVRDGLLALAANLPISLGVTLLMMGVSSWWRMPRFPQTIRLSEGSWTRTKLTAVLMSVMVLVAGLFQIQSKEPEMAQAQQVCTGTVYAEVVAMDKVLVYNRLGAFNPAGMIYALRRDLVDNNTGLTEAEGGVLTAGQVSLRSDKRPRPLVLRVNAGDCLEIDFQNLLHPVPVDGEQPADRMVGIHVNGLQVVNEINDDGSYVGQNPTGGLLAPGERTTYKLFAEYENTYLLYNMGVTAGAEGGGGTTSFGLFGAVNVEPANSEWYRSQLTRQEMDWAATGETLDGHPIINYDAVYPGGTGLGKAGLPILNMLALKPGYRGEIVHSDLHAIITGLNRGNFIAGTFPANPAYPTRNEPFREITVIFHDQAFALQAFEDFFLDPEFNHALEGVHDSMMVNYGSGGVGAEIIANRLGVGPMGSCVECKYEEFFLTSWVVSDPAMIVDIPADATVGNGLKATKTYYPDDPSNVAHSYLNDRVIFRNLHAGPTEHHIFHLHAHQWNFNPDDVNSMYLDSQVIGPGAGYTYEVAWNAGNRNKTPGDSIFHCHFYPHFAQGMWGLWRVHDVFERGTMLDLDGRPVTGERALPDGEIVAGTPIPGVVPIPTKPLASMPGVVTVGQVDGLPGSQIILPDVLDKNPGYPFYVPAIAGHRPPTPPMDIIDDGGLPRHVITGGTAHSIESRTDFTKELDHTFGMGVQALFLPETGTPAEQLAMGFHAQRFHDAYLTDGTPAGLAFETNGLPAVRGAPFAEPCRKLDGTPIAVNRTYKGVNIQMDMVLNKVGWHFPQQRFLTLWEDALPTLNKQRTPEPLVMRLNAGDCAEFWHTNLVPGVYELDDYQVRTPTDIIGQHIHLVKFDVMASDGSANGFNYEDGTFSPDEVRERMRAIRANNLCIGDEVNGGDPRDRTLACPIAKPHPFFGAGPGNSWLGARTTVQRWYADPLPVGHWDDGLGTVFTHDHYGPSTHQQVGLYASVIIEPSGSTWRHSQTGVTFGTRHDGGPTSWRADILTKDPLNSHREFFLMFADFQHAYEAGRGVDANGRPVPDFEGAINTSWRQQPPAGREADIYWFPPNCPNGAPRPCPEAISAEDPGTYVVNYRNEPLGLRVYDPNTRTQA
jgi:manganese oxidase